MNLIRYESPGFPMFREMEETLDRLNRLFGTRPNGKENLLVTDWTPTVDIQETEGEYLVKAELPEVKKEDVKVTVENGVLTLQGERNRRRRRRGRGSIGSSAPMARSCGPSRSPSTRMRTRLRPTSKKASSGFTFRRRKNRGRRRST